MSDFEPPARAKSDSAVADDHDEPANFSFLRSESSPPATLPMNSVVRFFVTYAKRSFLQPWVVQKEKNCTGTGFVVAGRLLMTNAHVVEDALMIEVKKQEEAKKYQAKVVCIGHDVDLALVSVEDEEFWQHPKPLQPVTWAVSEGFPPLYSEVRAVGFPTGGSTICVTKGIISRIDAQLYVHPRLKGIMQGQCIDHGPLPIIQIDAAINPGNSGGPTFNADCSVVGVASSGNTKAQNIGYIIPNKVAGLFLSQYEKTKSWAGVSESGMSFHVLESRSMCKYLNMGEQTGVMIRSVAPLGAAAGKLFPKDIVTKIDDKMLSHEGKITQTISGQDVEMSAEVLITQKPKGAPTLISLIRDGKEVQEEIEFAPVPPLAARYDGYDCAPQYVIIGGLVFTQASVPLVDEYLKLDRSQRTVTFDQEALFAGISAWKEAPEHEVVLLLRILKHSVNLGYDGKMVSILERFNGERVSTLAGLAKAADAALNGANGPTCDFLRFFFKGDLPEDYDRIVLEAKDVHAADMEICKKLRIPTTVCLEQP